MIRRTCAAVLFVLLCAEVARHGPLSLRAPETILSNTTQPQKDSEPYVRFLRWVASQVPPGATVAILTPESPTSMSLMYLIAVGQLPLQDVWPAVAARGNGACPDFVAPYSQAFEDSRYRQVGAFQGGALFRAR
jgi:hypothetical protein